MRVVAISDTHNIHKDINIPEGDILIHAGDITNLGSFTEFEDFNEWLGTLPHKHKVFIAGNHDFLFERNKIGLIKQALGKLNATYLQDDSIHIDGIHIYGAPWTPQFMEWAFMYDPLEDFARKQWDKIPDKVDILITHGPPAGILDRPHDQPGAGCADLLKRVHQVRPRYHIFGHIHEGYGMVEKNGTIFINAALSRGHSRLNKLPVVFEI